MKAVLRRIDSPDLSDMENEAPENPFDFQILVQAMIGPDSSVGEEAFDIIVCTPSRIEEMIAQNGYMFPVHHLIVERYDYHLIRGAVEEICESAFGSDWKDIANKLSKFGAWEFADYVE